MDDRLEAETVEFQVDTFGKVWVNVDNRCVLRVGRTKVVTVDDPARGFDTVYSKKDDKEETD